MQSKINKIKFFKAKKKKKKNDKNNNNNFFLVINTLRIKFLKI